VIKKINISSEPLTDQELAELEELIAEFTPIANRGEILVQMTNANGEVIDGQEMVIPFDEEHFKFIDKRAINKKAIHFEEFQGLDTTVYGVRIILHGTTFQDIILPNSNQVLLSKGVTIGFCEGSLDFAIA